MTYSFSFHTFIALIFILSKSPYLMEEVYIKVWGLPVFFVTVFIFIPETDFGQKLKSDIKFSGSNRLYSEYSTHRSEFSEIPPFYINNDLSLQLKVYTIPIQGRIFLSSLKSPTLQDINRFSIRLNPQQFIKRLPKDSIPGLVKFLGWFPTIEIGDCYPNYSPLVINGISLRGCNIEFAPGKTEESIYLAVAYGDTKKPAEPTETRAQIYRQELLHVRFGLGKMDGPHMHLFFQKAKDITDTVLLDTLFRVKPQENEIVGLNMKGPFLQKKLWVEGEINYSFFTRDHTSPELTDLTEGAPQWFKTIFNPTVSTSIDYAWLIDANYKLKSTTIAAGVKRIGPGYKSLGTPYMRTDIVLYEGKVSQYFFKKQVSLQLSFRRSYDNLIGWKRYTTFMTMAGANLTLYFRKLPYVMFSYMPYWQQNNSKEYKVYNQAAMYSANVGYNYKIRSFDLNSTVFYSNNNTLNQWDSIEYSYQNQVISFNQSVKFKFPVTMSAGYGYNTYSYDAGSRKINSVSLRGTYGKPKGVNVTLGGNWYGQQPVASKFGLIFNASYPLGKWGSISADVRHNIYDDKVFTNKSFNETIIRGTFITKW